MKQKINVRTNASFMTQKRVKLLHFAVIIFTLSLICNQLHAQSVFVKGVVKDSHGESVIGASVYPKANAAQGTISDLDGNFSLKAVPNDTIVVSYIGFRSYHFVVKPNHFYKVILQENAKSIDEVVVVGYGTQKKIALTGAVSTVKMDDIRKNPISRVDNALAGEVAGLISTQSGGGQPGADGATMYLRGVATFNGNYPLILIDGMKRSNIIGEVDPNEIESISVLKDASATAVFGVQGANGVIIITTKRGKAGKPKLSINVDQSYTSFAKIDERLHSWEYMELRNEALENDGLSPAYSDDIIAKFKNPLWGLSSSDANYQQEVVARKYLYCDHYWLKELFKQQTPQTKINTNLSGGTDRFTYFINAGFIHQGGNLKTESKDVLGYNPAAYMDKWNFRSNMDYKLTNTLKAQLNIGTYIQTTNMPQSSYLYSGSSSWMMSDLFYNALILRPIQAGPTTISGYGVPTGMLVDPSDMDRNPYEVMERFGFRNYTEFNLASQLVLEWDLSHLVTKGLSIKGMVSYDAYGYTNRQGVKQEETYYILPDYDTGTFTYSLHNSTPSNLSISRSYSSTYWIDAQAFLNYHRIFGNKHDVTGMINFRRQYWESGAAIPYNVIGLAGRLTYNYDSRYFAEFDMGYNGSEQFAPSHRFGFFPAFSVGYVISNEKFMRNIRPLDNLKLRYSNGRVGNDNMSSNRFLYLDNIQTSTTSYVGGLGTSAIRSISQGLLGNKNLTWELSKKQNWGIDVGLFKSFSLSFDYFTEKRSQILMSRNSVLILQGTPISDIPLMNIGRVNNHGYELDVSYTKKFGDLQLQLKGNYATNNNKVVFYDEPIRTSDYYYRYRTTGFRLNQCWGYKIDYSSNDGYWTSEDEIKNSGLTYSFGTPRPGDFKYVDMNKDGVIDEKDEVPIKYSTIPGINYGFGLNSSYKAFDFSILFQGLAHYSMYYSGPGVWENIRDGYYYKYQRTAWTVERWENHEKITYPALTSQTSVSLAPNDFFIQNRAFLRLKTLQIGYTLPNRMLRFMGVTSCRFYIGGENLCCWDHLHTTHLDPEQNNPYGYPVTKMVDLGFNVNF